MGERERRDLGYWVPAPAPANVGHFVSSVQQSAIAAAPSSPGLGKPLPACAPPPAARPSPARLGGAIQATSRFTSSGAAAGVTEGPSSWPSATLKRPPVRRGPGLGSGTPQPATSARVPPQPSPGRGGTSTTCSAPRRVACSHIPAGSTASGTSAGAGAGPDDATRFSLNLTPEAILVIQRRHLEKQLLARPRRPFPTPSADPRLPLVPCPRTRASTLRRGGPTSVPNAPLAVAVSSRPPRASLLPGGLQATLPSPHRASGLAATPEHPVRLGGPVGPSLA